MFNYLMSSLVGMFINYAYFYNNTAAADDNELFDILNNMSGKCWVAWRRPSHNKD